ncbi:MAG: hypothetical protein AAGI34_05520 [Pseudomonadota bacterium]
MFDAPGTTEPQREPATGAPVLKVQILREMPEVRETGAVHVTLSGLGLPGGQ